MCLCSSHCNLLVILLAYDGAVKTTVICPQSLQGLCCTAARSCTWRRRDGGTEVINSTCLLPCSFLAEHRPCKSNLHRAQPGWRIRHNSACKIRTGSRRRGCHRTLCPATSSLPQPALPDHSHGPAPSLAMGVLAELHGNGSGLSFQLTFPASVKGRGMKSFRRGWARHAEISGPVPIAQQCLGSSSKAGHCRALAVLQLSPSWHSVPCSKALWCQSKCTSTVLWQLVLSITTEMFEKYPRFCSPECWQPRGNLGEHLMGNNDRLNVISIAAASMWLQKVVTVQGEFSVLSQFSMAGDINP